MANKSDAASKPCRFPMPAGLAGGILLFAVAGLFSFNGQAQGLNPTKPEIAAFLQADGNGDGVLTKPEFVIFVKEMAKTGQSTARTIRFFRAYNYAFSVADKNRDGIITPQEMRSADNNHRANQ